VRSLPRCEVSRGSGGGSFFLPVARLRCRVLVGALWHVQRRWSMCVPSASLPFGYIEPDGVGVALGGAMSSATAATPACGVGAPCPSAPSCGTQALWRRLGRARPFGHTLDTVVSVRSVVSDARCPSITSMVQCHRLGPSAMSGRLLLVIAELGSR
jgi:hypothetical protein